MTALRNILEEIGAPHPTVLAEDPGPRQCRGEDCSAVVLPVQLRAGGYIVREVCESCRLRAQRQDLNIDPERVRVADAVSRLPRKYRWADLASVERTAEPPSPELAAAHPGQLVLPIALRATAKILRDWLPNAEGRGVLLHGPVGSGKTALLAGAFTNAWRRGLRGSWTSERSYLTALRAAVASPGRQGPTVEELFGGVDFVVLDELGSTDAATAWNRDRIEDLVCQAYDDGVPLWVTSNRAPGDTGKAGLQHALGERAFTRLLEMTLQLEVAAGSWRPAR